MVVGRDPRRNTNAANTKLWLLSPKLTFESVSFGVHPHVDIVTTDGFLLPIESDNLLKIGMEALRLNRLTDNSKSTLPASK
jgi:hypothetical protein